MDKRRFIQKINYDLKCYKECLKEKRSHQIEFYIKHNYTYIADSNMEELECEIDNLIGKIEYIEELKKYLKGK